MNLKENEVLRCPKCGGKEFFASAHVVQDWELDAYGNFSKCVDDCIEVAHYPDREDVWDCKICGYSGTGETFVTTKEKADEICLCECIFDLSALAGRMLEVASVEVDAQDLFHHILNWSREFTESFWEYDNYKTAVAEFGREHIAGYIECLKQRKQAEETQQEEEQAGEQGANEAHPEVQPDTELVLMLVSAAPEDRETIYEKLEAVGIDRETADKMATVFQEVAAGGEKE